MTVEQYNECVDNHSDNLYRFILKNIGDTDKAKDIVQETFIKFWEKKDHVNPEKVKSYLFTTAYHTLIDLVRKDKRYLQMDEFNDVVPMVNNQYTDIQEILHRAIDKLPHDQKAVILLRDYEGYSYQEISEITGMNETRVKVYIFRGRKFLKNYLVSIETIL